MRTWKEIADQIDKDERDAQRRSDLAMKFAIGGLVLMLFCTIASCTCEQLQEWRDQKACHAKGGYYTHLLHEGGLCTKTSEVIPL